MATMPGLLPVSDALAATGLPIHERTANRWVNLGRVPGAVRIGGRWFVRPCDLEAALTDKPFAGGDATFDLRANTDSAGVMRAILTVSKSGEVTVNNDATREEYARALAMAGKVIADLRRAQKPE